MVSVTVAGFRMDYKLSAWNEPAIVASRSRETAAEQVPHPARPAWRDSAGIRVVSRVGVSPTTRGKLCLRIQVFAHAHRFGLCKARKESHDDSACCRR